MGYRIRVGRYLGAADFLPVPQAHIMIDTDVATTSVVPDGALLEVDTESAPPCLHIIASA